MAVEENQDLTIDFNPTESGGQSTLESLLESRGDAETPTLEDIIEIPEGTPGEPGVNPGDQETPIGVNTPLDDGDLEIKPGVNPGEEDKKGGPEGTPEEVAPTGTINYKETLKSLMAGGVLDEIDVFEDEDGNTTSFDEMEIDQETFTNIINTQFLEKQEAAKAGMVSLEDSSDTVKRLFEIDKAGGDLKAAFETIQNFQNPMDKLDLTKKEDQRAAIYMMYKAKNYEDKDAMRLVNAVPDSELEETALGAKETVNNAVKAHLDVIEERGRDRKARFEENLKKYRKGVSTAFENFDLKPTIRKKLTDVASKQREDSSFEIDEIIAEWRLDPEKTAEMTLFFTDKEEYLKQVTEKIRTKDKIKAMKIMRMAKKDKSSIELVDPNAGKQTRGDFIDLDTLKNR